MTDRAALSPQQAEVLRLLSAGLSIPAIALTMFISQSTAKTYVARLYEKLGVTNRAQALMAAVQLDLIPHEHGAAADAARATGGEHRTVNGEAHIVNDQRDIVHGERHTLGRVPASVLSRPRRTIGKPEARDQKAASAPSPARAPTAA